MLSKGIMEKCYYGFLIGINYSHIIGGGQQKVMKLKSILDGGPDCPSVYRREMIQKCVTQIFSALAYCNPLMRRCTCAYQEVTIC